MAIPGSQDADVAWRADTCYVCCTYTVHVFVYMSMFGDDCRCHTLAVLQSRDLLMHANKLGAAPEAA